MSEQVSEAPINKAIAYAVAALGVGICLFTVFASLRSFGTVNDLPEYYAAARMMVSGQSERIYDLPTAFALQKELFPALNRGVALFVPPPAVPLLLPLALVPADAAPMVWTVFLLSALVVSLVWLSRINHLSLYASLWLVGLVTLSGPAIEAVRLGQLAPLMLLALTAFVASANKHPRIAGVLLDVLLFKPQQLFAIALFGIASLRRNIVMPFALGAIALVAVSQVLFGVKGMTTYLGTISDFHNISLMQPELNPTIRGQSLRLFGIGSPIPGFLAAIGMLSSSSLIGFIAWRNRNSSRWITLCLGGLLPLGLLTSFHCHDYDLLLLVPGMVAVIRTQVWRDLPNAAKIAAMLGIASFLVPFYNDIHYSYLLRGGPFNAHFAVLLVFAVYLAVQSYRRPAAFEDPGSQESVALEQ